MGFQGPWRAEENVAQSFGSGYFGSIGLRKYLNSFTSYQFPNPFPPGQDPLSRLEFPIDQWFVALKGGYATPGWNAEMIGMLNVTRNARSMMQDSDWTDGANPGQKTIFSESQCKMNSGFSVDAKVDMALGLTAALNIRPLVGWRLQRFSFTTYDGEQFQVNEPPLALLGNGIEFKQTFYHYYLGGVFRRTFDGSRLLTSLPLIDIEVQADYGMVVAGNEDLHLLRAGHRVTQDNTRGHCWHANLQIGFLYTQSFRSRLEGDFMRIVSHGSHRLTNPVHYVDFSFDGARVWSDQASFTVTGELSF